MVRGRGNQQVELTDPSASLADANLLGAVVLQSHA